MLNYENKYWSKGYRNIAGVDEAGRGPLAGPVVSAAVIFPETIDLPKVNDSKKISEKKREDLFEEIFSSAIAVGIGIVHESEIDKDNILQATYTSMRSALADLALRPEIVLVDGNKADIKHYKQENIIKGDQKSLSIAAASIIAKVTRDRIMRQYDLVFPEYGFYKHKGYGTKQHIEAIKKYFVTPIHRQSFNPVPKYLPSFSFYKRNQLIGNLGIQLVASSMIRCKEKILEIKYKIPDKGRIDIISLEKNILIFTQVKTFLVDIDAKIKESKNSSKKNHIKKELILFYKETMKLKCDYKLKDARVILGNGKPKIDILVLNAELK